MSLLGLQDVSLAFGGPRLLDHADFSIERGERVCLLGRNGAGKSTLMKLLDGTIVPDTGSGAHTGMSVARLEQEFRTVCTARSSMWWPTGSVRPAPCSRSTTRPVCVWHTTPATRRSGARPSASRTRHRQRLAGAHARGRRCSNTSRSIPTLNSPRRRAVASGRRCSRARSWRSPTCCCSTSPPTISTCEAIEWMEEFSACDRGRRSCS